MTPPRLSPAASTCVAPSFSPGRPPARPTMNAPRVLILSDCPLMADALRRRVGERFPGAACQQVVTVAAAAVRLASRSADIFVLRLELLEGDALDLLRHSRTARGRTLVIAGSAPPRVVLSLRALAVEAVHDLRRDSPDDLDGTLDALAAGGSRWSASFGDCLCGDEARRIRHQLGPREQLVFALLATGLSEKTLAEYLGLTLSSARSLGRDIHAKLGLHDRRDVERAGARLGYTRFAIDGLRPFGLSILIDEYRTRSLRPAPLPAVLLAECGFGPEADAGKSPVLRT